MYSIYVRDFFEKFGVEFFILALMFIISWGGIEEILKIIITHLK
jgi:hypothetical protein